MRIALTGFQNAGRTTIFNALCDSHSETSHGKGRLKVNMGVTKIRDDRLDFVSKIYNSQKKTPAEILFQDFEFQDSGIEERKGLDEEMITHLKLADALIYICRGFTNASVYYPFQTIDPLRDAQMLESDMIITDLSSVENRLQKVKIDLRRGKKELQKEFDLMEKIKDFLDEEKPLRLASLSDDDEKFVRGFGFLTLKKGMVLVNTDDDGKIPGDVVKLENWVKERDLNMLSLKGKLQADLKELDEKERDEFLKELGVDAPAIDKFIRAIYKTLGLIQFFTGNANESRAWDIPAGTTAYDAAGVVHQDFQAKFIRAEVISHADFVKYGSEKACKEAGVFRTEKREYIVQDGDVIFFRHN